MASLEKPGRIYASMAVTIRPATHHDRHAIVRMGVEFHKGSPYKGHFLLSPQQCLTTVDWLLAHGAVFVAERDEELVGMIGVAVTPHLMSGELTCGEVFWWVDPKARGGVGLRLLRQAQTWGQEQGATVMTMVAPDPRVEKLYERLKFRRIESAWAKEL